MIACELSGCLNADLFNFKRVRLLIGGSLLLTLSVLAAQENTTTRGARLFSESCATGYCHGAQGGAGGGAPRLAGRGLTLSAIRRVITNGNNEMPAFVGKLTAPDLDEVIAYVGTLNGISAGGAKSDAQNVEGVRSTATLVSKRVLSPAAAAGRALFFEAIRSFGRCSTCHRLDGNGIAIAGPIDSVLQDAATLRALKTPRVRSVKVANESFPALIVKSDSDDVVVYDLTIPPPVNRILSRANSQIAENSEWRHSSVIQSYNDVELTSILSFLRELRQK